jgi:hypothetical protein
VRRIVALSALLALLTLPGIADAKLTRAKARPVAQKEADEVAGQPTEIYGLVRRNKFHYDGHARWNRLYWPDGSVRQSCTADLVVWKPKRSPNVKAEVNSYICLPLDA